MPRFRTCRVAPAVLLLLGILQLSLLELGHAAALDHEAAPSWDPADPHADHYQAALAFEKAGDDDAALQALRAATRWKPAPKAWLNLGDMLLDVTAELHNLQRLRQLLSEARDAYSMALKLDSTSIEARNGLKEASHQHDDLPLAEGLSADEWDEALDGAAGPNRQFYSLRELREYNCSDANLRVDFSHDREAGSLTQAIFDKATRTLRSCGVVQLSGVYDPALIERMRLSSKAQLERVLETEAVARLAVPHHRAKLSDVHDTPEVSLRSTGRWEVKVPMEPPWSSAEVIRSDFIWPLVMGSLATKRVEMDTYSSVTALGRTPVQHWHVDAAPLFKHADGSDEYTVPHGLVLFIPLDEAPIEAGPTEFFLKSHLPCSGPDLATQNMPGPPDPQGYLEVDGCRVAFEAGTFHSTGEPGDAVIFDLRVMHRGGRNTRRKPRPMVYATYMQEWYIDAVNFHEKQSKEWGRLPMSTRKLLRRLDTARYVARLETLLNESGVDASQLRARQKFRKVDL